MKESKRILLIDADSTIPNLALMKLSTYWKDRGFKIFLKQLEISYYPRRKKEVILLEKESSFYKTYCSIIFRETKKYIQVRDKKIIFGGSGFSLEKKLPPFIEKCSPDYTLYPTNDCSYGFISRGCVRNCSFCIVPKKEGSLYMEKHPEEIIQHKKVKFLDNNFLALPKHKEILSYLIEKNIKCCFNQGLDIRLIDSENSFLLSKLNYWGEYTFAFDSIGMKGTIEKKLSLLSWRKDWQLRFFCYVNPKMPLSSIIGRIIFLKERKILPYVMRDISCWESEKRNFYTDLASFCNQVFPIKKMSFIEYVKRRNTKQERIKENIKLYKEARKIAQKGTKNQITYMR